MFSWRCRRKNSAKYVRSIVFVLGDFQVLAFHIFFARADKPSMAFVPEPSSSTNSPFEWLAALWGKPADCSQSYDANWSVQMGVFSRTVARRIGSMVAQSLRTTARIQELPVSLRVAKSSSTAARMHVLWLAVLRPPIPRGRRSSDAS